MANLRVSTSRSGDPVWSLRGRFCLLAVAIFMQNLIDGCLIDMRIQSLLLEQSPFSSLVRSPKTGLLEAARYHLLSHQPRSVSGVNGIHMFSGGRGVTVDNHSGLERLLHVTTYSGRIVLVPQGLGEVCELSLLRRTRIEGNRFSES